MCFAEIIGAPGHAKRSRPYSVLLFGLTAIPLRKDQKKMAHKSRLTAPPRIKIQTAEFAASEWALTVRSLVRTIETVQAIKSKTAVEKHELAEARRQLDSSVRQMGAHRDSELLRAYELLIDGAAVAIRPFVADDAEAKIMGKLPSLATSVFSRIGRYSAGHGEVARAEVLMAELNQPIPAPGDSHE
jgi:hypothetical protein